MPLTGPADWLLTFVWLALEFGGGGRVVNRVASLKYAERDCTHHVEVGQDSMEGGSCLVAETLNKVFPSQKSSFQK